MFKSIGFVISLIAIRLLLPAAFHAFESASVQFFGFTTEIFRHPPTAVFRDLGQAQAAGVLYIPQPAPMPANYPMSQESF